MIVILFKNPVELEHFLRQGFFPGPRCTVYDAHRRVDIAGEGGFTSVKLLVAHDRDEVVHQLRGQPVDLIMNFSPLHWEDMRDHLNALLK